jgi:large subunit ribosomal protein L10
MANERRIEKVVMAEFATETVRDASYLYLITYVGIDVAAFSDFRNQIVAAGSRCTVMKNSYIALGLNNNDIGLPEGFKLFGDTAVVAGEGDPCPAAKVIKEFGKESEQITFKAGVVDGSFISAARAIEVAEMPSKEVLQAQLLGLMLAPAQQFVSVLNQSVAQVVNVLKAYQDKLEEQS